MSVPNVEAAISMFEELNNRFVLVPKLLYLSNALCFYILHNYRGQFITERYGIKSSDFAMFMAIAQCISFVVGLYVAILNDQLEKQKQIVCGSLIIATVVFNYFFMTYDKTVFIVLFTIYLSFLSFTPPILDKFTLDYLINKKGCSINDYGRQRLFTAIGYMILNFILDEIIKTDGARYNFDGLRHLGIIAGIFAIIISYIFIYNTKSQKTSLSGFRMMSKLFRNGDFMFFILLIFLNGIVRASISNYINLFYDQHLNFKNAQTVSCSSNYQAFIRPRKKSLTSFAGNIFEFIIFFVSPWIISKVGLVLPLFLSQIFQLVRCGGYYIISPKSTHLFEKAFCLELFKGLNFGLIQSTATSLALKFAGPNLKSTAQLIYTGTFIAIGNVFSGVLLKMILSRFESASVISLEGYRLMFLINIIVTLLCMILMAVKYVLMENIMFSIKNFNEKIERMSKRQ